MRKRAVYNSLSIRADVSINLALPLYPIAPMESEGMSRFFQSYPPKCYKTPEHLFRLSPPTAFFRSCRGCIRRECCNFVTQITIRDPFTLCLTFRKVTKSTLKKQFPIKKFGRFNKMHYLCTHENPPSLFTMLKSAGRFIFLWHIIQRPTHRPPS